MKQHTISHPTTAAVLSGVRITPVQPGAGDIVTLQGQPADVSRYGVVRMVRRDDGSYLPIIKTYTRWVRFSAKMLVDLNLHNALSVDTLQRLVNCGVIAASRPSPQTTVIDVDSLLSHLERTRDTDWWTDERRKCFRLGLPIRV